jgi:hypothetical protein
VRVIGNTKHPVWVKIKVPYVAEGDTCVYYWVQNFSWHSAMISVFQDTSPLNYVICLVPVHNWFTGFQFQHIRHRYGEAENLWLVSDVRSLERIRCAKHQRFGIQYDIQRETMAWIRQWFRFSGSPNYKGPHDVLCTYLRGRITWYENVERTVPWFNNSTNHMDCIWD